MSSNHIVFLCPGQGAQSVGMAKAWASASAQARQVLETADRIFGAGPDGRSLTEAGRDRQVRIVASLDGRFAWPAFHSHFDALFTIAKTMELCTRTGLTLAQAFALVPPRTYHHLQVACSWEAKGGLMRRMSEAAVDADASFVDGVRIATQGGWVLVLPDQHRPVAHIFAESADPATADRLRDEYRAKVVGWINEMAATATGK